MMESFTTHTGIVSTLNRANVDTDAIIPKQFLKSIRRTGYGPNAFFDWRYDADGSPDPGFELNHPRFNGRSILVTRNNFGCGSSREHAVWALVQDGYRVVVAPWKSAGDERLPGFADIFSSNALKNGLLTIELSESDVDRIFALVDANPGMTATADLHRKTLECHCEPSMVFTFEIEDSARDQLLKGMDEIDMSLQFADDIARFEAGHQTWLAP
jgi:3-isopropylmalate/(R)-2-methylmalate dehydratase small subunit